MGFLMSFLVVTRAKITYDHYMENSECFVSCYKHCRELVQEACVLSMTDKSESAKDWRQDVCYATILLLRATVAVLKTRSSPTEETWELPELELGGGNVFDFGQNSTNDGPDGDVPSSPKLGHLSNRIAIEEATRVPDFLAFYLKREILKMRDGTWLRASTFRHPVNEELAILTAVDGYMKSYAVLRMLLTTVSMVLGECNCLCGMFHFRRNSRSMSGLV